MNTQHGARLRNLNLPAGVEGGCHNAPAMTMLPRRLAALATILLVAAMVAILALRATGAPVAIGPSAMTG